MQRHPVSVSHTIPEIVEAAAGIIKVVRRIIELPKPLTDDRHQTPSRLGILAVTAFHPLPRGPLVTAQFPKHRTAQVLPYDPIGLPGSHVLVVEGNHFLLVRVVGPRCECVLVMVDGRPWKRKSTIVIAASLPRALSDSIVCMAWSVGVHKRPAVQRNTDDELVPWDALCMVPFYGGFGVDWTSKDVRLVVCGRVPRTSIIIGLETLESEDAIVIESIPSGSRMSDTDPFHELGVFHNWKGRMAQRSDRSVSEVAQP